MNFISISLIALSPFLLIGFFYFLLLRKNKKDSKQKKELLPKSRLSKKTQTTHLFYSESMLKSRENIHQLIQSLGDDKLKSSWLKVVQLISSIESDDEYVERIKKHRLNETLLQDVEKLLMVYSRMRDDKKKLKHEETDRIILHIASILQELKDNIEDKKEDEYNRLHDVILVRED